MGYNDSLVPIRERLGSGASTLYNHRKVDRSETEECCDGCSQVQVHACTVCLYMYACMYMYACVNVYVYVYMYVFNSVVANIIDPLPL